MTAQLILECKDESQSGHDYECSFVVTDSADLSATFETPAIKTDCPERIPWIATIFFYKVGNESIILQVSGKFSRNSLRNPTHSFDISIKLTNKLGLECFREKISLAQPFYSYLRMIHIYPVLQNEIHCRLKVTIKDNCDL
ncbi:hypothetical protein CDAR_400011 [Caerostris darwini]|uniref:Uncharacterized protein n=1 Tax=Caerostris darwini TaxID=1538125 RepID=A0AAV4S6Q3_9ARAC|nr:hypothetical protein CDAR_400011 [Caerostris darwini]